MVADSAPVFYQWVLIGTGDPLTPASNQRYCVRDGGRFSVKYAVCGGGPDARRDGEGSPDVDGGIVEMEGQHNAALFRIELEGGADAAGFTGCSLPEADRANTASLELTLPPKLRWRAEHILLIAQQATSHQTSCTASREVARSFDVGFTASRYS